MRINGRTAEGDLAGVVFHQSATGSVVAPDAARQIARARSALVALILVAVALCLALEITTGLRVDFASALVGAEIIAAALLASLCWRSEKHGRVADCFGVLGFCWLAGIICGLISLIALRLNFPLRDEILLRADRIFGLDDVRYVGWIASRDRQIITLMTAAYSLTLPILFLSMAGLALAGDRIRAWRAALCFVGSLLTTCVVSIATPAKGLGVWLPAELFEKLPGGAARYFWQSFDEFRAASDPVLRVNAIDGVVSFPSFHAVMGLLVIAMWHTRPVMLTAALMWAIPMFTATTPLGGHYFVDLAGGAVIWSTWALLSARLLHCRDPEGITERDFGLAGAINHIAD